MKTDKLLLEACKKMISLKDLWLPDTKNVKPEHYGELQALSAAYNLLTEAIKKEENKYKCNLCGEIVSRDSNKKWIKSFCEKTGKMTRLIKIEFNDKLVTKLCNEYLPKGRDLSTFDASEKLHLQMAFEQGVRVMMNTYINISNN